MAYQWMQRPKKCKSDTKCVMFTLMQAAEQTHWINCKEENREKPTYEINALEQSHFT
jgi:hypothetical protein